VVGIQLPRSSSTTEINIVSNPQHCLHSMIAMLNVFI
jgi:hypothetical protein